MIDRYSLPEMAAVFSDTTRFGRYLEIELLATEAQARLGVVPPGDAETCRAKAPGVDDAFVRAVAEREAVTDHDVAAFVDVVQASIGQPAAPGSTTASRPATSSTPRGAGRCATPPSC